MAAELSQQGLGLLLLQLAAWTSQTVAQCTSNTCEVPTYMSSALELLQQQAAAQQRVLEAAQQRLEALLNATEDRQRALEAQLEALLNATVEQSQLHNDLATQLQAINDSLSNQISVTLATVQDEGSAVRQSTRELMEGMALQPQLSSLATNVSLIEEQLTAVSHNLPCGGAESWVRLAGGNTSAGRLEVFHAGQWGTVCDDDFEAEEAQAFCKTLVLPWRNATETKQFGPGEGRIWLDQVDCAVNASSASDCKHDPWGKTNCGHNEDIGIICL